MPQQQNKNDQIKAVYKKRLELLVSGYSNENAGYILVPDDVLKLIEREYFIKGEPKLILNRLNEDKLEIYLDKTANKLLNIHKYKVIEKITGPFLSEMKERVREINTYDKDYYIGFIPMIKINKYEEEWHDFEIIGLDKDNNILIKLNKRFTFPECPIGVEDCSLVPSSLNFNKIHKYIDLNQWIIFMQRYIHNEFDDLLYRRIFFFMIWQTKIEAPYLLYGLHLKWFFLCPWRIPSQYKHAIENIKQVFRF